jgi:hypothetical protein
VGFVGEETFQTDQVQEYSRAGNVDPGE